MMKKVVTRLIESGAFDYMLKPSRGKKKERYGNFDANEAMQAALERNFFEEEI